MIAVKVSAVCLVRDGYTGKILPPGGFLCTVDGAPCRPVGKPEGYLVFTGLSPGPHRLALRRQGFREEWLDFEAGAEPGRVLSVDMKPDQGYPFRPGAARLHLTVKRGKEPGADCLIWLAAPGPLELKVAQEEAEAGAQSLRLYWKGRPSPAVPGSYLVRDGKHSEVAQLRALSGETGRLYEPLRAGHKRGTPLLSAQRCHTGGDGVIEAAFPGACTVEIYEETAGLLEHLPLSEGENRHEIALPVKKGRQ